MKTWRITLTSVVAILALAALVRAADPSGRSTATFMTEVGEQQYAFEFKVGGLRRSPGTAKSDLIGESELQEGKVDGDKISVRGERELSGNAAEDYLLWHDDLGGRDRVHSQRRGPRQREAGGEAREVGPPLGPAIGRLGLTCHIERSVARGRASHSRRGTPPRGRGVVLLPSVRKSHSKDFWRLRTATST